MSQAKFFIYITRLTKQERRNRKSWSKELGVTPRTITNFNNRLEQEYGIKILFSGGSNGYYSIDKKEKKKYDELINFIQNLNSPTKIAESFIDKDNFGKHLIFHQDWNKVDWMRHFNPVLQAINNQQYVSIEYYSFRNEKKGELMYFMPYWMKQNAYLRWYIIGFRDDNASFPIVIGLDKIISITIDDKKFDRKSSLEVFRREYENVFGVYMYEGREPDIVRLECTRFQATYLKSLPLHPSQEIESENEIGTIFRFKLVVNHEFAYELLRQNVWNFNPNMLEYPHPKRTAIKVLEPSWFVDYFHQTYKRSYQTYARDLTIIGKIKKDIDEAEYPYPLQEF